MVMLRWNVDTPCLRSDHPFITRAQALRQILLSFGEKDNG